MLTENEVTNKSKIDVVFGNLETYAQANVSKP